MTIEGVLAVAVELGTDERRLVADIASAAARARKAEPGDRLDIVRFETLCSQFEAWTFSQLRTEDAVGIQIESVARLAPCVVEAGNFAEANLAPPEAASALRAHVDAGCVVVVLNLPLELGSTSIPTHDSPPPPPADRWESPDGSTGRRAVEQRFEAQIKAALAKPQGSMAISPSGIQNEVVTKMLREYVATTPGSKRRDVPVEYRDSSRSQFPFPLRAVHMADRVPNRHDPELSFALLSIRHTEMDVVVDGAWLRNSDISRPRLAAQTDDLVHAQSGEQLDFLTNYGQKRVLLRMYQTGLETAVMGFYRAVTEHLIKYAKAPGSLTVIPMYYQEPKKAGQGRGRTKAALGTISAPYLEGKVWANMPRGKT